MTEHFVIQLLHKHYTGQLEPVDKKVLEDWLEASPDNMSFGKDIRMIWEKSASYHPSTIFQPNVELGFSRFQKSIQSDILVNNTHETKGSDDKIITKNSKVINFPIFKWAAASAASIALLLISYHIFQDRNSHSSLVTLDTISEQIENIKLVDQSEVWINQKSTFSYFAEDSPNVRNVSLKGEAFFDVEVSQNPFVIETENAIIKVLGTEFNVDSDTDGTTVEVKSGKVELSPKNSSKTIVLTENMVGTYNAITKELTKSQTKNFNGNSWLTGGFSFENATLKEVFTKLEDHYKVNIIIESKNLEQCIFTSPVYQNISVEEVLDVMKVIYGFEYEKGKENILTTIKIKQGGC